VCGRFNLHHNPRAIADEFGVEVVDHHPRYNIAPTQYIPLVRPAADRPGRELVAAKWGLIPSWATDPSIGNRLINARADTAATKPAFRSAYKHRRCLIPASGFYEWSGPAKKRQPHNFTLRHGRPFALAGLWECWGPEQVESFTILTTDANELMGQYHDRMPVIIHPHDYDFWMTGKPEEVGVLLRPYPCEEMTARPVSLLVNSPRNDGPELLA
jgi:putative SOS response-associated peptidase YedK